MKKYRIREQYRTRVRLSCAGCLTVVVLVIVAISRCSCMCTDTHTGTDTLRATGVHLNDSLSNEVGSSPELHDMDSIMERYLRRWEINGAQLAISRNDSLLYARGFGKADEGVEMQPSHILRLASVS